MFDHTLLKKQEIPQAMLCWEYAACKEKKWPVPLVLFHYRLFCFTKVPKLIIKRCLTFLLFIKLCRTPTVPIIWVFEFQWPLIIKIEIVFG